MYEHGEEEFVQKTYQWKQHIYHTPIAGNCQSSDGFSCIIIAAVVTTTTTATSTSTVNTTTITTTTTTTTTAAATSILVNRKYYQIGKQCIGKRFKEQYYTICLQMVSCSALIYTCSIPVM